MTRLALITKNFIIATRKIKICPSSNINCLKQGTNVAKALLVLRENPKIINSFWRECNPKLHFNNMGTYMSFNTENLYSEVNETITNTTCKCLDKIILPSNNGVTPQDPKDGYLILEPKTSNFVEGDLGYDAVTKLEVEPKKKDYYIICK